MSDTGNVSDAEARFEIYVPSPKARINLGKPNTTETGPFGYTGLSLQSDVHLFIDANKHTLFQTGQHYCGQVGGKWMQYSNANMFLSSTANMNLSADNKITIAAGAGQGQITALDHGTFPRVVNYNSLNLHYRVDALQTSLFEFLHGRHKHQETGLGGKFGGEEEFVSNKWIEIWLTQSEPLQTDEKLEGGFIANAKRSMEELCYASRHFDAGISVPYVKEAKDIKKLTYGFSPYLKRFDPYDKIESSNINSIKAKGFAKLRNGLAYARRTADVARKLCDVITDNFVIKRLLALAEAGDALLSMFWKGYHLILPLMNDIFEGSELYFSDEAKSGVAARFGGAENFSKIGGGKASITSEKGPWDLSNLTEGEWALTVYTEHPEREFNITLEQSPATAATLNIAADPSDLDNASDTEIVLAIEGETVTVRFDSGSYYIHEIHEEFVNAVGGAGIVGMPDPEGKFTIKTNSVGVTATIIVRLIQQDGKTKPSLFGLAIGIVYVGEDGISALQNLTNVTAEQIVERIGSRDGLTASAEDGRIKLESTHTADENDSYVKASGTLAEKIFGLEPDGYKEDRKTAARNEGEEGFKTLISLNHELQKLPEDTRNLSRPITQAIDDFVAALSALDEALEKFAEVAKGTGLPSPPEAIGLIAQDGITLGTQDRIIGSGGKGIVFVADGGSGTRDRSKFIFGESVVANALEIDPLASANAIKPSLGFRVLSDSTIDLAATTRAELLALGRGNVNSSRRNEETDGVGIGIARIAGSYAAEVVGYEKVRISARSKGKDNDTKGETGGVVEVDGQCIRMGNVKTEEEVNGVKIPLKDLFGIRGSAIESIAGNEHLKSNSEYSLDYLDKGTLPNTTHIDMHATEQAEIFTPPFRITSTKEGIRIGVILDDKEKRNELRQQKEKAEENFKKKEIIDKLNEGINNYKWALEVVKKRGREQYGGFFFSRSIDDLECRIDFKKGTIEKLEKEIELSEKEINDAVNVYKDYADAKSEQPLPRLELTKDKILLGFTPGDGDWGDLPHIEITKDGVNIIQNKAEKQSEVIIKKDEATVKLGDTAITTKKDDITISSKSIGVGKMVKVEDNKVTLG